MKFWVALITALLSMIPVVSSAQIRVSLSLSATTAPSGTRVDITASVVKGVNPATVGVVDFYDAAKLVGSVQITGTTISGGTVGTAILRKIFAPGVHPLKATYRGNSSTPAAPSTIVNLTVTGNPAVDSGLQYAGYVDFAQQGIPDDLGTLDTADLNLDGIPDLLVAQFNSVQLGTALSNLGAPSSYSLSTYLPKSPYLSEVDQVYTADFDGDGLLDVVEAGRDGNNILVYRGITPGTFSTTPTVVYATGQYPQIIVADLNNDGLQDVGAVTTDGKLSLWLNNPNQPGKFIQTADTLALTTSQFLASIVTSADVNGDSLPDIISYDTNGNIVIALNDPSSPGTKWNASSYAFNTQTTSLTVGDLNGDGLLDIIVGESQGGVGYALQDSAHPGTFLARVDIAAIGTTYGVTTVQITVGDVNGDGKLDVISADGGNHFEVFLGVGDGTLVAQTPIAIAPVPLPDAAQSGSWGSTGISVVDMDGDGLDDVALIESRQNTVQIFRHQLATTAPVQTSTEIFTPSSGASPGQPIVITASETAASGNLTGKVEFYDFINRGYTSVGTAPIVDGQAVFTLNGAASGSHDFVAVFHGDSTFSPSQSAILSFVVNTPTSQRTSISLTASPNQISFGSTANLTAAVTSTYGSSGPTGSVVFLEGSRLLGTAPLINSVATYPISTLASGQHGVHAVYTGDSVYGGATSNTSVVTVVAPSLPVNSAAFLTVNPISSPYGSPVQMTVSVSGTGNSTSIPSGSVSLSANGTTIASSTLDSKGWWSSTLTSLDVGMYPLVAKYGGDINFNSSSSNIINVNITSAPTTTTVTASPNPGVQYTGEAVQARVANAKGGSVQFMDGTTALGSATVDSSGIASLSVQLAPGSHSITAVYAGTAQWRSSTSQALLLQVAANDFSISAGAQTLSMPAGTRGTLALTLQPVGVFGDDVALSCTGLPQRVNCTFDHSTLHLLSGTAASAVVTVDTSSLLSSMQNQEPQLFPKGTVFVAALSGFLMIGFRRKRSLWSLVILCAISLVTLSGCKGSNGSTTSKTVNGTGTYIVTIVGHASANGFDRSTSVTLNITQ